MLNELAILLAASAFAAAPTPDWVKNGGKPARLAKADVLIGYAVLDGEGKTEGAKTQAAGELAQRISVRIKKESTDVSAEKDGAYRYYAASLTQATSDIRLSGLEYETHVEGGKSYALAILQRGPAAAERRGERDRKIQKLSAEIAAASKAEADKREAEALERYLGARNLIAEALEISAVARAIAGAENEADRKAFTELSDASQKIEEHVRALLKRSTSTMKDAVETLAIQLEQQGVTTKARWTIEPLTYGPTSFSSVFGREVSQQIERALAGRGAKAAGNGGTQPITADLAIRGTYLEAKEKDEVRLTVVAREAASGRCVASAEAALPKSSVPKELALLPQNFMQALEDQKILASGEDVSGDLNLEVTTQKGNRALVFGQGEEIKIFFRVNRPAYVRVIYLLANKLRVPLEQAYYIDASKVNKLVEYPDAFEVSAPFGVEQIHATAFTEKPAPLPTKKVTVEGEEYEVIVDDMPTVMATTRGAKRKQPKLQTAENTLSLTTMPK